MGEGVGGQGKTLPRACVRVGWMGEERRFVSCIVHTNKPKERAEGRGGGGGEAGRMKKRPTLANSEKVIRIFSLSTKPG